MKKLIAATIALLVVIPNSAFADESASPRPKVKNNQEYKAALEKWKSDNQAAISAYKKALADYMAKVRENAQARKAANDAFKKAVDAAKQAYKSALATATTPEAKTAIENARKVAIAAATAARDAAIKAIAALPAKPVKPAEAPKPAKPSAAATPTATAA